MHGYEAEQHQYNAHNEVGPGHAGAFARFSLRSLAIILFHNLPVLCGVLFRLGAEHVWEHLTHSEGKIAAGYCYRFLKKDGYLRIAVPDGNHPSHEYIEMVRVGGKGCGSDDHKILYDQNSLSELLTSCGFLVNLIEYFDSEGDFHSKEWDPAKGMIHRSANNDSRNTNGQLVYTSLIIDAVKR